MNDYESLFQAINLFTKDLVQGEIDFWEEDKNLNAVENYMDEQEKILKVIKTCTSKETVLRLGHGSGWIFMTGCWIKNSDLISDYLYYLLEDATRPNNRNYRDYFFPKTRRMDEEGELLGFVKLSLEG